MCKYFLYLRYVNQKLDVNEEFLLICKAVCKPLFSWFYKYGIRAKWNTASG